MSGQGSKLVKDRSKCIRVTKEAARKMTGRTNWSRLVLEERNDTPRK